MFYIVSLVVCGMILLISLLHFDQMLSYIFVIYINLTCHSWVLAVEQIKAPIPPKPPSKGKLSRCNLGATKFSACSNEKLARSIPTHVKVLEQEPVIADGTIDVTEQENVEMAQADRVSSLPGPKKMAIVTT